MKIKKIETYTNQYVGFVKVITDDNHFGWGQMSTYNADITTQIFHRQVAPWSLGLNLSEEKPDFSDHLQLILEKEHKIPWILFAQSFVRLGYSALGFIWKI